MATTRADKSKVDIRPLSSAFVFIEFVMANKKEIPAAFSAKSRTDPDGSIDVIVEKTIIKANIAMGTVLSPTVKLSLYKIVLSKTKNPMESSIISPKASGTKGYKKTDAKSPIFMS